MSDVRPAAVAGMFYPGSAGGAGRGRARASCRARGAVGAGRASQGADRRRTPATSIRARSRPSAYARLAAGRDTIRRVVLFGPTHRVPVRGLALPSARAFATPLGTVDVDREAAAARADAAAGLRKRRGARARALARGAAAVPAVGARRIPHRPVRRRRRVARRGRRGHRPAVGRPRDADRRQLRPVALPPLRGGPRDRPRDRRGDPRALGHARPRAGLRRDADQRTAAGARGAAGCGRSCSTCATPATRRATSRAWSATRRSPSPDARARTGRGGAPRHDRR